MKFTITSDQYDDSLALGGSQFVTALLDIAQEVIRRGGVVVIQTDYINAPAEIRQVFRTSEDLSRWEDAITRVTELAKQQRQAAPETSASS